MEISFEAWNKVEVAIAVSNRAGRDFLLNSTKLLDISQKVGVPLVVYSEGGLCGVTRRTQVRGRAQTEEIATTGRIKVGAKRSSDWIGVAGTLIVLYRRTITSDPVPKRSSTYLRKRPPTQ